MSMILGLYNYWIVIVLMMIGFYIIIAHGHLIKKIVGLNIFQTSVFIFYISLGKVEGGTAPICKKASRSTQTHCLMCSFLRQSWLV